MEKSWWVKVSQKAILMDIFSKNWSIPSVLLSPFLADQPLLCCKHTSLDLTWGTHGIKKRTRYWVGGAINYLAAFTRRDEPQSIAGKPCGFHNSFLTTSQCNAHGGLVFLSSRGLLGASPPERWNGECQCWHSVCDTGTFRTPRFSIGLVSEVLFGFQASHSVSPGRNGMTAVGTADLSEPTWGNKKPV